MKKKIIAMILAAAMSCQPVMIYAADAEVEFSDDESSLSDDMENQVNISEDEKIEDIDNEKTEVEFGSEEMEELFTDNISEENNNIQDDDNIEDFGEIKITDKDNIIDSGRCGGDINWTLDEEGVLSIYGKGAMYDYSSGTVQTSPWRDKNVKKVVIQDGITTIGSKAFHNCSEIQTIVIPKSIVEIKFASIYGCYELKNIYYGGTETEWKRIKFGDYVFRGTTNYTIHYNMNSDDVTLENNIYVGNLEQIYWPQSETEQFVFVIDALKYNITNNVNLSIDHFIGEKVIYTLVDGKIDNIEPISELVQPCIAVNATPDSFFYQNGGYNTDKITATVKIYCKYQAYSEYFGESKYTKEELQNISYLSIPVKQVNLKIGDHLNFGTTGKIFKKEITEVSEKQINLSLKNPISYKYDIYVENKYVPTETIEKSALSATVPSPV